mgnify:CR=1 FL=1
MSEENNTSERAHDVETRIQTIGMLLIVGFLSWVGTGLVDVKVGLAQVLSESVSLRNTLDRQNERLTIIENDISNIKTEMGRYITREELRETIRDIKEQ